MAKDPHTQFIDAQVRHTVVVLAVITALGVVALVLMSLFASKWALSLAWLVAVVGAVGGTANNYRRLQKLSALPPEDITPVPDSMATAQIYLSPVVGGVFALVLYGLFQGGVLEGSVFPGFQGCAVPFESYGEYVRECKPAENNDVALALVWGFIAGFAELLVPNVLDKMAVSASGD